MECYWNIIRKSTRSGLWELSRVGYQFLMGNRQVPKELWVFNNEVIEKSEDMVNIGIVDPRWQIERLDYTLDYLPYKYNLKVAL